MNATVKITGTEAPLDYQAEVVREQVRAKIERRFHDERNRLFTECADEIEQLDNDHLNLSATAFLAKYQGKA